MICGQWSNILIKSTSISNFETKRKREERELRMKELRNRAVMAAKQRLEQFENNKKESPPREAVQIKPKQTAQAPYRRPGPNILRWTVR
ncbi:hypothetical protein SUGI_0725710 [Cryptomeria japonica]|nr:hypothetical protein SUGI_0725710 [Cryptomeria japonica]